MPGNLSLVDVFAWTPEDYKVSKTFMSFFANFIKTGIQWWKSFQNGALWGKMTKILEWIHTLKAKCLERRILLATNFMIVLRTIKDSLPDKLNPVKKRKLKLPFFWFHLQRTRDPTELPQSKCLRISWSSPTDRQVQRRHPAWMPSHIIHVPHESFAWPLCFNFLF